jgi:eukaryotic-like serine/threonine-protein kinase
MGVAPGERVGPYEIVAPLGAGGMGEVWRARDPRLGREVAIKVLPAAFATDTDRLRRFEQEARATGALNHPNVLAVYDVGTHDGAPYLVTELLEGETLRERLRAGAVPWRKAVEWARQITAGLAAAHDKNIVHRDLKPENLFVTTDGRVKILDFGLARTAAAGSGTDSTFTATEPGAVLGTAGYMAPEQVRGRAADARSDIFAFGTVLYELLAGKRAFDGESHVERGHAILTREPPPLDARSVPPAVERVVRRCLEKRLEERFQSARDLGYALEALSSVTPEPPPSAPAPTVRSIAVLPLANLSPDPEQEFFCDGLTEEIITALSQVRGLRVISRNSVMTLKGKQKTTREIGELLHVDHVLEGSVRRAGNDLRIVAQLIDATTDGHLWAERYAGTLDDVFAIQEQVARAITDALQVQLSPAERQRLGQHPASDPRVVECFQRARHARYAGTKEAFERGVRLLQQGLDAFGEQPLLCAGLVQAHFFALEFLLEPREAALASVVELVRRVEPRHVHAIQAKLERYSGNYVRAISHFEDAVAAEPGDVDSLLYLAWMYAYHAGKRAAGAAAADRLASIDPLTTEGHLAHMAVAWGDGDFAGALAVVDDVIRAEPDQTLFKSARVQILFHLGRTVDAITAADRVAAESPTAPHVVLHNAYRHAVRGERDALAGLISGELESALWNDGEAPEWFAGLFGLVGDRDRAFRWLERWIDRGAINYPLLAHGDPLLEPLRKELRFQRLLDRIKPEWEAFVPRFQP